MFTTLVRHDDAKRGYAYGVLPDTHIRHFFRHTNDEIEYERLNPNQYEGRRETHLRIQKITRLSLFPIPFSGQRRRSRQDFYGQYCVAKRSREESRVRKRRILMALGICFLATVPLFAQYTPVGPEGTQVATDETPAAAVNTDALRNAVHSPG